MIGTPKPFASLSSGLLARKGQAKPAMRPQGYAGYNNLQGALDDLGWNDMGSAEAQAPVEPEPIRTQVVLPPPPGVPPVLRQRAQLREEIEEQVEPAADAPVADVEEIVEDEAATAPVLVLPRAPRPEPLATAQPAPSRGRKAAFTLRLDADRHLRLRLASAVSGRSAQQLVTEALDRWLDESGAVDELARHVPAQAQH